MYTRGVGSNFQVARPSKLCFTSVFFPKDLFGKEMLQSRSGTGIDSNFKSHLVHSNGTIGIRAVDNDPRGEVIEMIRQY